MKKIGQWIDYLSKLFGRVKSLGYLVALVFLFMFVINHGCQRQHAIELAEKITGLNYKNDILKYRNDVLDTERDSLEKLNQLLIKERDSILDDKKYYQNRFYYYKKQHDLIAGKIDSITSDSSYKFLQQVAYPFSGKRNYGFNSRQVKGIHTTYVENKNKRDQIYALSGELQACNTALEASFNIEDVMKLSIEKSEEKADNFESIIINKDEQIKILEKELGRNNKWFAGFGIGPQVGIGYDFIHQKSVITFGIGIQYNLYKW